MTHIPESCRETNLGIPLALVCVCSFGLDFFCPLSFRGEHLHLNLSDYLTAKTQRGVASSHVPWNPKGRASFLSGFLACQLKQPMIPSQSTHFSLFLTRDHPTAMVGVRHLEMPAILKPFQPFPQSRPESLPLSSVPVFFAFPALLLGLLSHFLLLKRWREVNSLWLN